MRTVISETNEPMLFISYISNYFIDLSSFQDEIVHILPLSTEKYLYPLFFCTKRFQLKAGIYSNKNNKFNKKFKCNHNNRSYTHYSSKYTIFDHLNFQNRK